MDTMSIDTWQVIELSYIILYGLKENTDVHVLNGEISSRYVSLYANHIQTIYIIV